MLSESALYEKQWGPFPFLGSVLEPLRQQFVNSQYLTSVTDIEFDRILSLLWTAALASAHPDAMRDAVLASADPRQRAQRAQALHRDLRALEKWLGMVDDTVRKQREGIARMTHELMRDIDRVISPGREPGHD